MTEPENCSNDCGSCSASCPSRKEGPVSFLEAAHELSHVKKVIGIVSGKGGVGKSMTTSLLAATLQRRGLQTAILDADITGPSIPTAFGIKEKVVGTDHGMLPVRTRTGIEVISINLLLEEETDPVVWRGPMIAGVVKQFWKDVIWHDVDVMFVDMPPGTGDVPLTVFQSLPVDGIIVVTSPQELVNMVVAKAVNMAKEMNIPILGVIENMSYLKCPDCGKEIQVFGESKIDTVAANHGLKVLGRVPIDPTLATASDRGMIESYEGNWLDKAANQITNL